MYRTEVWMSKLESHNLKTPICIPSYNRPNAPIFDKLSDFSKDDVFVFIRNNPEQKNLYKYLSDFFTLVYLPDYVEEVGTTRQAILEWAIKRDYENIFVLGDRITKVNVLSPKTSKSGKQSLVSSPNSNFRMAMIVWEFILKNCPFTMSCPSHSGFSYFSKNIGVDYEINNGNISSCISINVKDFQKHNIKYESVKTCGFEDATVLYRVLKAGLPVCKITDLEYDEVKSEKIFVGGNRDSSDKDRMDFCEKRNKLFWENILNVPYGDIAEGVYLRKSGQGVYPYFKWDYWKEYFLEHSAKEL